MTDQVQVLLPRVAWASHVTLWSLVSPQAGITAPHGLGWGAEWMSGCTQHGLAQRLCSRNTSEVWRPSHSTPWESLSQQPCPTG